MYQLFEWLSFVFKHDGYHCVSLYTLNSIRLYYGIPDEKLHLIYNGVDTDFWDAKNVSERTLQGRRKKYGREGKYVMLYYGHSGVSKGIDYLIEAIPEIVKENPDGILIFNLIPAKRDREVKTKIRDSRKKISPQRRKGREEGVFIFNGREKEQLRELIATADVVIAPSLAEGFGSVHSEACAMGKTLITTQVAAIPEVVSGNVKFVQPCSPEAIVEGIREVRSGNFTKIAKKAFDWDGSVEKIEKLYESLAFRW